MSSWGANRWHRIPALDAIRRQFQTVKNQPLTGLLAAVQSAGVLTAVAAEASHRSQAIDLLQVMRGWSCLLPGGLHAPAAAVTCKCLLDRGGTALATGSSPWFSTGPSVAQSRRSIGRPGAVPSRFRGHRHDVRLASCMPSRPASRLDREPPRQYTVGETSVNFQSMAAHCQMHRLPAASTRHVPCPRPSWRGSTGLAHSQGLGRVDAT